MSVSELICWLIAWSTRWATDGDERDEAAVRFGVVEVLLRLVLDWAAAPMTAAAAAYALGNLWFRLENARQIGWQQRALATLQSAIESPIAGLRSDAISALSNFLIPRGPRYVERHAAVLDTCLAATLRDCAAQDSDRTLQQRACHALSYLALTPRCQQHLIDIGVPVVFVGVLRVAAEAAEQGRSCGASQFLVERAVVGLASLVGSEENAVLLLQQARAVPLLLGRLRQVVLHLDTSYSEPLELLTALQAMSANDNLKKAILGPDLDALPLLTALVHAASRFEDVCRSAALRCLFLLSFSLDSRPLFLARADLVDVVTNFAAACPNAKQRGYAQRILFNLGLQSLPVPAAAPASSPLVFLSYSWAYQPLVLLLRDKLVAAGVVVWIDVEQMSGSTLEAMAHAVETASVVLYTVGKAYKESGSCRLEAEYFVKLNKPRVPLNMETGWTPSGWLGITLGQALYFDCSTIEKIEANFAAILLEVNRKLPRHYQIQSSLSSTVSIPQPISTPIVSSTVSIPQSATTPIVSSSTVTIPQPAPTQPVSIPQPAPTQPAPTQPAPIPQPVSIPQPAPIPQPLPIPTPTNHCNTLCSLAQPPDVAQSRGLNTAALHELWLLYLQRPELVFQLLGQELGLTLVEKLSLLHACRRTFQ